MTDRLIRAALQLTSQLNLRQLVQEFVDVTAGLTGAGCCALAVLDERGGATLFAHHGPSSAAAAVLLRPLGGPGELGPFPAGGLVLLDDLTTRPLVAAWPTGHQVEAILGLPVPLGEDVFGRVYLAEKPGGFTAADAAEVRVLAEAAGIAIANCRRYGLSQARERWLRVSQEIGTALLEGAGEEEALQLIASRVRTVAGADTCLLILPSVGGAWTCEIADGYLAEDLIGVGFPEEGRALSGLRRDAGVRVDSLALSEPMRVPQLRSFGPALYAPMTARGAGLGVILLLRRIGAPAFEASDLMLAEALAQQTAVALELASSRHAQDVAQLSEERRRISRDLHDLAIQHLFATGMQLEAARVTLAERNEVELADLLDQGLAAVEESARQIRGIVQALREQHGTADTVERLRREVANARHPLGFVPSLVLRVDGKPVEDRDGDLVLLDAFSARIGAEIADDMVAVVREGLSNAARHAGASAVAVEVSLDGVAAAGTLRVLIADDGSGLAARATRRSGLEHLAARARRYGGSSALTSDQGGRGARLEWAVPLA